MIVRSLDWFIPIRPPINALISDMVMINLFTLDTMIMARYESGASFCHVDRMKQLIHDIDAITDGYHRWNGANPILRARLIVRIKVDILVAFIVIIILEINSRLDPRAWFKKYFTAASVSWYI